MGIWKKFEWHNLRNRELWILLPLLLAVLLASVIMVRVIDSNPKALAPTEEPVPDRGDVNLAEIHWLISNNELGSARGMLDAMLRKQPRFADGWALLGTVNYRLGDYQDAEIAFRKLIRFRPQDVTGYHNLSQVLRQMRRFDEALNVALQAAKLAPENGAVLTNVASLLAKFRRDAEAVTFLRQALKHQAVPEIMAEDNDLVRLLEQPEFEAYYRQSRQENK